MWSLAFSASHSFCREASISKLKETRRKEEDLWFLMETPSLVASFIPLLSRMGVFNNAVRGAVFLFVLQFRTAKCNQSRNCPRRHSTCGSPGWTRENGHTVTHRSMPSHSPPPYPHHTHSHKRVLTDISKSKNFPWPDLWKLPNPAYNWGDLRDGKMFSFSLWESLGDRIIEKNMRLLP